MATLSQAKSAASKIGATLTFIRQEDRISLDLADRTVLYDNGCHYYDWYIDQFLNSSEAYDNVIKMISYGIENCIDPNCDICNH